MHLQEKVAQIESYLIETRRHLHQYPEPSLKEYKTSEFIQKELDRMGIAYEKIGETGTLAIINGKLGKGKTVLLRADIDALEIEEKTQASYASKNKGLSHACGHDAHTAMGLGSAKILQELSDTFAGTIKIAFQPAEEIGAGAKQFVQSGKIQDVNEALALHVRSDLKVGCFAAREGAVNASCDIFKINVTGLSSHVGHPELGKDALVTASEIVVALQTIVAREVSATDSAVVGVGILKAGTRYNIVANHAYLEGTIRAFSHETRAHLKEAVTRIAQGIGSLQRCEVTVEWYDAAAPVINDEQSAKRATQVARDINIFQQVATVYEKSMGADDFADYLVDIPGVYVLLGSQGSEKSAYGHHHEKFDIDERALALGVHYEVAYLLDALTDGTSHV